MKMMILLPLMVLLGYSPETLNAQDSKKEEIPKTAQKELKAYRNVIDVIRKDSHLRAKAERERLLVALEKIKIEETKKGNLESAWALKQRIEALRDLPFNIDEVLVDPANHLVTPGVEYLGKPVPVQSQDLLIRRIENGSLARKTWDNLEGTVVEISAGMETRTDFPVTKNRGILIVPHPGDRWHGKEGNTREYPWVGYAGQKNRLYRNMPIMSLCHRLSTANPAKSIIPVYQTPVVFGSGKLILMPNDGVMTDNQGKIRVKLVPITRDQTQ